MSIAYGGCANGWNTFWKAIYRVIGIYVGKISVEAFTIHTSQGLEFEYVGVIIGEDMRFENGKIVTDFRKRASTDKSLNGIVGMYNREPERALKVSDEIIKNTYRTLMTRGMKGCYVYCVDRNLADYLKKSITAHKGE